MPPTRQRRSARTSRGASAGGPLSASFTSSPWPIPVPVYDEDYRDGSFRFSHVVTRHTAPFRWPNTLTLESAGTIRAPALMSAPLVILRPFNMRHRYDSRWYQPSSAQCSLYVSVRHPKDQRQRVIATNDDEWEEHEEERPQERGGSAVHPPTQITPTPCSTPVRPPPTVLHHMDPETGNAMLHFYSPLVTYALHPASGCLHLDSVCWVLSDITCMPERIHRATIERMKALRASSIKKQQRDHRVVVDLGGERAATFVAESWTARDSLRAAI